MPNIKIIAVRESDEPSFPTSTAFFDLMNEIEEFQNEYAEVLCYDHYEPLTNCCHSVGFKQYETPGSQDLAFSSNSPLLYRCFPLFSPSFPHKSWLSPHQATHDRFATLSLPSYTQEMLHQFPATSNEP